MGVWVWVRAAAALSLKVGQRTVTEYAAGGSVSECMRAGAQHARVSGCKSAGKC